MQVFSRGRRFARAASQRMAFGPAGGGALDGGHGPVAGGVGQPPIGALVPLVLEGTGVTWLLPVGRPSARSGRSSLVIAELEGGLTLASACRAARSSPPRGLEDASKPRFDRRPTAAVHQVL